MSGVPFGLPPAAFRMAVAAGLLVGVVYLLSPLTVWFLLAMLLLVRWAAKDLTGGERRWILGLLLVAIALRMVAVGALFALTDHSRVPFNVFFGDEAYYLRRSIWMRNLAIGVPLHVADLIYMFDETGFTSHLSVLAFLEVLVGPAPYGAHLLGAAASLTASVILFRAARPAFGRIPASIGLVLLLFLPSLFAWSISALKEPPFFLLTAAGLSLALQVVRQRAWSTRAVALVALVGVGLALDTIRQGGLAMTVASIAGGLLVAFLVRRPRTAIAAVIAIVLTASVLLSRPPVQFRATLALQNAIRLHWGHVATPGYVYHLLDDRLYPDRSNISGIRLGEVWRFIVRAGVSYLTVPLPWQVQSRSALAFLPEQLVWYLMLMAIPVGLVFAWRRDVLFTSLLVSHAVVAAIPVALTSGNIGTLVRHRGFALPYLVWLAGVGAYELLAVAARWQRTPRADVPESGSPFRMKPACP